MPLATNKSNSTPIINDHAQHHNDMATAINALDAELGVNPSGSYSTVKDRLDAVASSGGYQTQVFATSFTPNPANGHTIEVGQMTSDMTVNLPATATPGEIMTLIFQQDATGGRNITFAAGYTTGGWEPPATPSSKNAITFVATSSSTWQQISGTGGGRRTYSIAGYTTRRTIDKTTATLGEITDVLLTVIADLQERGQFGGGA